MPLVTSVSRDRPVSQTRYAAGFHKVFQGGGWVNSFPTPPSTDRCGPRAHINQIEMLRVTYGEATDAKGEGQS